MSYQSKTGVNKSNKAQPKSSNQSSQLQPSYSRSDYVTTDTSVSARSFEESQYESETEGSQDYCKGGYHPVYVGEKYRNGRYTVLSKLGWGQFSTVWLVYDSKLQQIAALKVQKSAKNCTEAAKDEIRLAAEISKFDSNNEKFCVRMFENFTHKGPNGDHTCMVFEVLGDTLLDLIKKYDYKCIPLSVVRNISKQILIALDYIHRERHIIHTDIKPENVMLKSPVRPRKWDIEEVRQNCIKLFGQPNQIQRQSVHMQQQSTTNLESDIQDSSQQLTKSQKKRMQRKKKGQQSQQDYDQQQSQISKSPSTNMDDAFSNEDNVNVKYNTNTEKEWQSYTKNGNYQNRFPQFKPNLQQAYFENKKDKPQNQQQSVSQSQSQVTPKFQKQGSDMQIERESNQIDNNSGNNNFVLQTILNQVDDAARVINEEEMENVITKLVDFGNGCWTHTQFSQEIQTRQYRSPEVILGQKYDTSADIWSFACTVFELATGDWLFQPKRNRHYSRDEDHLALMIELLGKIPKKFFNRQGQLKRIKELRFWALKDILVEKYKFKPEEVRDILQSLSNLQSFSILSGTSSYQEIHSAQEFSDFLLPMLKYQQSERATAEQMLQHPWLHKYESNYENNITGYNNQISQFNDLQVQRSVSEDRNMRDRSHSYNKEGYSKRNYKDQYHKGSYYRDDHYHKDDQDYKPSYSKHRKDDSHNYKDDYYHKEDYFDSSSYYRQNDQHRTTKPKSSSRPSSRQGSMYLNQNYTQYTPSQVQPRKLKNDFNLHEDMFTFGDSNQDTYNQRSKSQSQIKSMHQSAHDDYQKGTNFNDLKYEKQREMSTSYSNTAHYFNKQNDDQYLQNSQNIDNKLNDYFNSLGQSKGVKTYSQQPQIQQQETRRSLNYDRSYNQGRPQDWLPQESKNSSGNFERQFFDLDEPYKKRQSQSFVEAINRQISDLGISQQNKQQQN